METTKIEVLQNLASQIIGDGSKSDMFFVTDQGVVVTVTRDFDTAYAHWKQLARRSPFVECALENRTVGVLASVEPDSDDDGALLEVRDDTRMLRAA